ncbi:inositol monophosphatase [Prauserella marina]|uniref:Inositol-1-monophosphatase n=1 Tax=Prauserella marina TaxID=530584 RepID=A0A222VV99_9PSEU|nr:inositol monophosphatase family protein [Prauserella marina]ASR37859.1 inositol monophosphatase [Prauserella marina]PWV73057.1 myo-inositol-1(or 4)-monophosphatase [Prauserella marina]SDD72985.1 myo-inositol-1(or 4)-monophosphatase [Prauserella marina]
MKDLNALLAIAQEAANIGAKLMTTSAPGTVRAKGDRDYVTELDIKIQHEIQDHLRRATPDIDFLGEEEGGGTIDESTEHVWALDPIDGTSNFAHGIPLCATSLALVHRGEPVVGVIVAPFLNLRYHATKGGGAYCNDKPIHASETTDLSRAIVSIGDYATGPGAEEKNRRRFAVTQALAENVERVRMFGAASLDLAWVAEGRTDACVIMSNKPWDMASGGLLARESSASITDIDGLPHDFKSRTVVATTGHLKRPLVSIFGNPNI